MLFTKSLIIFILGVLIAFSNGEFSQCDKNNNVTEDDWTEFRCDLAKPSEKILCTIRCRYIEKGALDSDGLVVAEKMDQALTKLNPKRDASGRAEAIECMKNVAPVKTCADTKQLVDCLLKSHKLL